MHYRAMYRYAFTILYDAEEARGTVREVWTRLLLSEIDIKDETAETYLKRLVHNQCINLLQHKNEEEKEQNANTRYVCTTMYGYHKQSLLMNTNNHGIVKFNLKQPAEKGLIAFGKLAEKRQVVTRDTDKFLDKHFHIAITQGEKGFVGEAVTDSLGHFAVGFPDTLKGEWKILILQPFLRP